jgi:hypothetical protein
MINPYHDTTPSPIASVTSAGPLDAITVLDGRPAEPILSGVLSCRRRHRLAFGT